MFVLASGSLYSGGEIKGGVSGFRLLPLHRVLLGVLDDIINL